jgi:alkanesulfonate monooxygenase SsuD/methylene tetrahydromethanopterin reductase-like flavin-dependent oxidoreductase (luciferase family)
MMEIGIFDHVDRSGLPLEEFYEGRLRLAEAYDRGGFTSYHIAEHHSTPLGLASSPGVLLASVAQRTERLRFGPLVYTLPYYHPIRLTEEICMLDQMSRGRLELGVGRGSSPVEAACYGLDPEERQGRYEEALEIIRQGLTHGRIDHEGPYYRFRDVPLELAPVQTPHPPMWVGVVSPDSADRAARAGQNIVGLGLVGDMKILNERFRAAWADSHGGSFTGKIGMGRLIVVAKTDEAALELARRAYRVWRHNYHYLYRAYGTMSRRGEQPPEFDQIQNGNRGVAGSPETVIRTLREQLEESGVNYCVGQFAFGDMTPDEALGSVDLFVREVMPALRDI